MSFFKRQEPTEFTGEMPDNYEDEEYYGEEEEGYGGEEDGEDFEDEEDDEPGAPAPKGNFVKTALIGMAALLVIGVGGYYLAATMFPDAVNDIVNNLPFVSKGEDPGGEVPNGQTPPPVAGGEVAPPPEDVTASSDVAGVPTNPGMVKGSTKPGGKNGTPMAPRPTKTKNPAVVASGQPMEGMPPGGIEAATKPPVERNIWKKPTWKKSTTTPPTTWKKTAWKKTAWKKTAWKKAAWKKNAVVSKRWGRAAWRAPAGSWAARQQAKRRYWRYYGAQSLRARQAAYARMGPKARYAAYQRWVARQNAQRRWAWRTAAYARYPAGRWWRHRGHWHYASWKPRGARPYADNSRRAEPRWIYNRNGTQPMVAPAIAPALAPPMDDSWAPSPNRARYGYAVQVGSFADAGNASQLVSELRAQGLPAYVSSRTYRSGGLARVLIGRYRNRLAAAARMRQLQDRGIPAAVTGA